MSSLEQHSDHVGRAVQIYMETMSMAWTTFQESLESAIQEFKYGEQPAPGDSYAKKEVRRDG